MFELILIAVCFIVYWSCLRLGLAGDDQAVLADQDAQDGKWKNILKRWRWPIRLPVLVTYALNFRFGRGVTTLFHITDVVIHSLSTLVVYQVLQVLGFSSLARQIGSVMFATHPLSVNAVANIAGRSSLLSGLFALIGIWCTLIGWWPIVLVAWVLAFLCKQDAFALPVLFVVLALLTEQMWWPYVVFPLSVCMWQWRRIIAFFAIVTQNPTTGFIPPLKQPEFAATFLIESLARLPAWFMGFGNSINPSITKGTWRRLLSAILVWWFILLGWWIGSTNWKVGIAILVLSPWTFYAFKPIADIILEHRAYINVLGMAILVALITPYMFPEWVLLWLLFLAYRTIRRSAVWDTFAVWEQAVKDGSTKPLVLLNWSSMLIKAGRLDDAEQYIMDALRQAPRVMHGWINLGQIHQIRGNIEKAHQCFRRAAFRNPKHHIGWQVLRAFYQQAGRVARVSVCDRRLKGVG